MGDLIGYSEKEVPESFPKELSIEILGSSIIAL